MNSTVREELYNGLNNLCENEFEEFKWRLMCIDHRGKPNICRALLEKANKREVVDRLIQNYGEDAPKVYIHVLQKSNLNYLANKLEETLQQVADANTPQLSDSSVADADAPQLSDSSGYRDHIKQNFQTIEDPNAVPGDYVLLNQRYSELIILDNYRPVKEREHEILATGRKHFEIISKRAESSTSVEKLFNPNKYGLIPQTVVLQGAAGIGKTTMAKKIMLDWASQQLYHDKFNYVFYIYCREMNLHADSEKSSIAEIISKQWPRCHGVKNVIENILKNEQKLLFIIDGFDELRYSFDQPKDSFCFDPWKEEPVKIILRSLFRKKLLPESSLIITTRPIALEKLHQCLQRPHYFQIVGFSREKREEYFYKFFENEDQATQALRFVKQNDTLFTMCVIPLVSWIICTVVKQEMETGKDLQKAPCTLTAIYMWYLSSLLDFHHKESKQDVQRKLKTFCSLAAEGIWKHQILFMEEEVKKLSLDQDDLFPLFLNQNIFKRDIRCVQNFSFIHLSFQEFFAALFYILEGGEEQHSENLRILLNSHEIYFRSTFAVGFHFLFGFLNEENRMKELKKEFGWEISSQNKKILLDWVKEKIDKRIYRIESGSITGTDLDWVMHYYPKSYIFKFFHKRIFFYMETEILSYLYETQDENFVKDALCAVTTMEYHCNSDTELMILAYCLQYCQHLENLSVRSPTSIYPTEGKKLLLKNMQWDLDEEYMEDFFKALTKLRHLRVLRLEKWSFTQSCSRQLVEVFKTNQKLKELNLFLTNDTAIQSLCEGLQHPDCKIEILEVGVEAMTEFGSRHLAEVFRRNQTLRDLKLWVFSRNDQIVERLCEGLQHPDCKVEKLWLNEEFMTKPCSWHVAEILRENQRIRELWLCLIYPEDQAFQMLCKGLQHPDCKVEKLWVVGHTMTKICSGHLAKVFRKSKTLRELWLWLYKPGNSVVEMLCEGLQHPDCKVEKLGIHEDFLTKSCSKHFLEVLKKNQRLRELQLFLYIIDEGVEKMLSEGLQHPDCKIEKLRLEGQFLKESFCRSFAEILRKNQGLRELDLFPDYLDDKVVEMLCEGLKHPDCKIEKLGLGAKFLTQSLSREFTHVLSLRDLEELFPTNRDDRAAEMPPAELKYSNCKLKTSGINAESLKKHWRRQIVGIVKINQKLRELNLQGDYISDNEMKLLWEELKHSGHNLKELWLNEKHIVQKGEWMETEHAARASSANAFSCLLI